MTRLSQADLTQFTGTGQWYRHGIIRHVLFTDGAKYVADTAAAYWLLDEVALAQRYDKRVAAARFQVWTLTVNRDETAILACDDGNGRSVFSKHIEWTDFPPPGITLWFSNNVIYLPTEH
jgi:hypothetical protein